MIDVRKKGLERFKRKTISQSHSKYLDSDLNFSNNFKIYNNEESDKSS